MYFLYYHIITRWWLRKWWIKKNALLTLHQILKFSVSNSGKQTCAWQKNEWHSSIHVTPYTDVTPKLSASSSSSSFYSSSSKYRWRVGRWLWSSVFLQTPGWEDVRAVVPLRSATDRLTFTYLRCEGTRYSFSTHARLQNSFIISQVFSVILDLIWPYVPDTLTDNCC